MKYQTIRIHQQTLEQLRLIYGITGQKMVDILERLVAAECERVKIENSQSVQIPNISSQESGKETGSDS